MKTLLRAAYIYTAAGPLFRDAAVLIDSGRIVAVGHPEAHDADVVDLGNSILLPGLINPHTHLELSDCRASGQHCSPEAFPDWILSLRTQLGPTPDFAAATRAGIAQCLRFGVTTVGDISQRPDVTRPILAASPLRCVSYGEVLGLAKRRSRFDELFPLATDPSAATDRLTVGISPHAPYTVDLPGYRQCVATALPLATHLAETPFETDFLQRHTGPFRQLWETIGQWSEPVETFPAAPIQFTKAVGLLDRPTLLAHVNYCTDEDLALLARGRASVVYCPRTHAAFGHPPHRFRDMLAAGVNVAVGTDSCASSPDLNPLAELHLIRTRHPELPADLLLKLVTSSAAKSLSLDAQIGSVTPGKAADLVAFPVSTSDPLAELLETTPLPTHLCIDGQFIPAPGSARS